MDEQNNWMVVDSLCYRLNDGINRDEINVTMVDGSHDMAARHEAAKRLLSALAQPVQIHEIRSAIEALASKAHAAIEHVGFANYRDRQSEAHNWINDECQKIGELLAKQEGK